MTRKRTPMFDLAEVLARPVRVTFNGDTKTMHPFEAEVERCAMDALNGNLAASRRFLKMCLREGLIVKPEQPDDASENLVIPKDWDRNEFLAMFYKHGRPPWAGERDGLTVAARAAREAARKPRRARKGNERGGSR
jgi:hypothetical protein